MRIARTVAAQSPTLDLDDVHQSVWEKWLRYPPTSIKGAWLIARSARDSLWRKEHALRRRTEGLQERAVVVDYTGRLEANERLQAACRVIGRRGVMWLARYSRDRVRHPLMERVKASKLRRRLRLAGV